jgi:hypothetical protein
MGQADFTAESAKNAEKGKEGRIILEVPSIDKSR